MTDTPKTWPPLQRSEVEEKICVAILELENTNLAGKFADLFMQLRIEHTHALLIAKAEAFEEAVSLMRQSQYTYSAVSPMMSQAAALRAEAEGVK